MEHIAQVMVLIGGKQLAKRQPNSESGLQPESSEEVLIL